MSEERSKYRYKNQATSITDNDNQFSIANPSSYPVLDWDKVELKHLIVVMRSLYPTINIDVNSKEYELLKDVVIHKEGHE